MSVIFAPSLMQRLSHSTVPFSYTALLLSLSPTLLLSSSPVLVFSSPTFLHTRLCLNLYLIPRSAAGTPRTQQPCRPV
ncbi:hypothetical protein B484DRAFT_449742 [Ochromonadaceae sp. CCMP2298]|nr:hypothetical protein B484DRAFT_449742 [Ochromonadaceae sp. CCMP2298]